MKKIVLPQIDCTTAREFLDALSPLGINFKDEQPNAPWLFRGQGVDKPLIPSLFRKDQKVCSVTHRNINDYSELRLTERDILIQFFQIADKRGLILPDDSQELRSFFEKLKDNDHMVSRGFSGWGIEAKGLSIIALAQHYGVPTRLLDWTRQPYIAAFFAAEDVYKNFEKYDPSSKLVVWAFYFPLLDKQTIYGEAYLLRGITAPSATNPNLKAQQGVFTMVNPFYTNEGMGDYLPFDKILEDYSKKYPEELLDDNVMGKFKLQKFTLPIAKAFDLLQLLAKLDITPSAIYPGYHSILSDLQMLTRLKKE